MSAASAAHDPAKGAANYHWLLRVAAEVENVLAACARILAKELDQRHDPFHAHGATIAVLVAGDDLNVLPGNLRSPIGNLLSALFIDPRSIRGAPQRILNCLLLNLANVRNEYKQYSFYPALAVELAIHHLQNERDGIPTPEADSNSCLLRIAWFVSEMSKRALPPHFTVRHVALDKPEDVPEDAPDAVQPSLRALFVDFTASMMATLGKDIAIKCVRTRIDTLVLHFRQIQDAQFLMGRVSTWSPYLKMEAFPHRALDEIKARFQEARAEAAAASLNGPQG